MKYVLPFFLIMENIIITRLNEEDIQYLSGIIVKYNRRHDEIDSILSFMHGLRDSEKRLRTYFVAKNEDGVVRGCMAITSPDIDLQILFGADSNGSSELVNCFVSPCGQGIGTRLFEEICREAKRNGRQSLFVQSGPWYRESWRFYDSVFDSRMGKVTNKYDHVADAIVWQKALQ